MLRHQNCIVCGARNPLSLGLNFKADDNGLIYATFQGNPCLQGYDGILHGGVISMLLDSAMTHCLFSQGIEAVTGDLQVRFIAPIPYDAKLRLEAKIKEITYPLYHLRSELIRSGKIVAWAEAKFMHKDNVIVKNESHTPALSTSEKCRMFPAGKSHPQ